MFKKALDLIEKYQTIIIHRHTNPDGDAIGSQVGMQQLIKENYPNKNVYIVGDDAKRYSFMEGCTPDNVTDDMYTDALAIVLDTSANSLLATLATPWQRKRCALTTTSIAKIFVTLT